MQLTRTQIVTSGVLVLFITGVALGAIAIGRSAARGARPAVTYSNEFPADWRVTEPGGANGREAPGFTSNVAHRFAFGEIVEATGRAADVQDELWREVRAPDGDAVWIRVAFLGSPDEESPTPPEAAPPVTTPPESTPTTTTTTTVPPQPVFDTERPGLWDVTGIADDDELDVRFRPGAAVMGSLPHDAVQVRATGITATVADTLWRQIEFGAGTTGWVNASYLVAHAAVPPVFGSEAPGRWHVTGLAADDSLNVRARPDTTGSVVARLAHDAVDIPSTGRTATVSGGLWRQVRYDDSGQTGWVSARYLTDRAPQPPAPAGPPRGVALMGDWTGSGVRTPGIFHNGTWYLRLANAGGPADLVFAFGDPGDRPVVGDWDGDGSETPGVVRNGTWHLRNSNSAGPADVTFTFGEAGGIPVAGDWDGDGVDTPGVVSGGSWQLRNSNSAGPADSMFRYGDAGDTAFVGDWDGDGVDTPGVLRGGRWLLRNSNARGSADVGFPFGDPSGSAVVGDWDADGVDSVGIVLGATWQLRNEPSAGGPEVVFTY